MEEFVRINIIFQNLAFGQVGEKNSGKDLTTQLKFKFEVPS